MVYSVRLQNNNWDHKLIRKIFTEVIEGGMYYQQSSTKQTLICLPWLTKPKTQVTSFMLVVIDFVFEPRLSISGCVRVHIKRGVCESGLLWSVTLSAIMMKYTKTTENVTIKCNTVANMRRDQRSRKLLIWCFSAQNGKKPPNTLIAVNYFNIECALSGDSCSLQLWNFKLVTFKY